MEEGGVLKITFDWISSNGMIVISICNTIVSILSILASIYISRRTIKSNLHTQITINELKQMMDAINHLTRKVQIYSAIVSLLHPEFVLGDAEKRAKLVLEAFKKLEDFEKESLNIFFVYNVILPAAEFNDEELSMSLWETVNRINELVHIGESLGHTIYDIDIFYRRCESVLVKKMDYAKKCINVLKNEYIQRRVCK